MTAPAPWPEDGLVEVKFATTSPEYPFVSIPRSEGCCMNLEKQLPRDDGLQAEYFSVTGADPDRVVEVADRHDHHGARVLVDTDQRSLIEFVVGHDCPARYLAARGAIPTTVQGTPDGGTIVAEIATEDDPGAVVDAFEADHAVELVAKRTREKPTPLLGESELRAAVLDRLTGRQREVLEAAYGAGYYERPRRNSGKDVAASLDISPTTFQEHLRAAERKLVTFLVEE